MYVALVVRDYDEAIAFLTEVLKFRLVEDSYVPEQDKRWVLVEPPGSMGAQLLLARPSNPDQERFVGNQTGGRVSFFLSTDDFWRDYRAMTAAGVEFVRPPVAPLTTEPELSLLTIASGTVTSVIPGASSTIESIERLTIGSSDIRCGSMLVETCEEVVSTRTALATTSTDSVRPPTPSCASTRAPSRYVAIAACCAGCCRTSWPTHCAIHAKVAS